MTSETPGGSRHRPWFEEEDLGRINEYFETVEWKDIVGKAKKEDKKTHLGNFWDAHEEFSRNQETFSGQGGTEGYLQVNRSYYITKLYYDLMEQTEDAQKSMEAVKRKIEEIRLNYAGATPTNQQVPAGGEAKADAPAAEAAFESIHREAAQPPRTGTPAWFLTPAVLEKVKSLYQTDEWVAIVEAVEHEGLAVRQERFDAACQRVMTLYYNEWSPSFKEGVLIMPDSVREGDQQRHVAKLYHAVLQNPNNDDMHHEVQYRVREAIEHNEKMKEAERDRVSMSARLAPPKLRAGTGTPRHEERRPDTPGPEVPGAARLLQSEEDKIRHLEETVNRLRAKYGDDPAAGRDGASQKVSATYAPDKKVLAVFEELESCMKDEAFEVTQPLTELLCDSIRDGGLMEHEDSIRAGILVKFTHSRLRTLRNLLEEAQKQWNNGFIREILGVVCQLDNHFDRYTILSPLNASIGLYDTEAAPRQQTHVSETIVEPGTIHNAPIIKQPLQHLRRPAARSAADPFSRFTGQGQLQMAGSGLPPRPSFHESPLARLVSTPKPSLPRAPLESRPTPFSHDAGMRLPGVGTGGSGGPQPTPGNLPRGTYGEGFGMAGEFVPRPQPRSRVEGEAEPRGRMTTEPMNTTGASEMQNINLMMMQLLNQVADKLNSTQGRSATRLKFPDVRASKFDGDAVKFLPWLIEFVEYLKLDPNLSDHHKVILLKQHLSDDVKEQLRFTTTDQLPYEECMRLLLAKFARTYQVRRAYRRKLQELNGPTSNQDYKGLDRLCMETRKLLNALELLGQTTDDVGVLVQDKLMDALPRGMYGEFTRFAYHAHGGRDPRELTSIELLQELERFAELQLDVQTHTSTASARPSGGRGRDERNREERRTETSQTTMVTTNNDDLPCAMCQQRDHRTERCRRYGTPEERRARFIEQKLCFKCARPHYGGVRECNSTIECNAKIGDVVCARSHHRALHDFYVPRPATGPPPRGDTPGNQGRSRSGDRGRSTSRERTRSASGGRGRSASGDRGRSRSGERASVRFVDEAERNERYPAGSGNYRRRV